MGNPESPIGILRIVLLIAAAALLAFIVYVQLTANQEAHIRIRHNLNLKTIREIEEGKRDLDPRLSQIHPSGTVIPLADVIENNPKQVNLHLLIDDGDMLIFSRNPQSGSQLLQSIRDSDKPEDRVSLRYDPTNGYDSQGYDYLYIPKGSSH